MPVVQEGEIIYKYFVNATASKWEKWKPPTWTYLEGKKLNFSNLLVPTGLHPITSRH
jgi:hypothetical protein